MNNENIKVEEQLKEKYHKAEDFFEKNRKVILIAASVVIGALLLVIGYKFYYLEPMQLEAQEQLIQAQMYYAEDSLDKALNGSGTYPGVVSIADDYGATKAGKLASYMAGTIYLKKGEFEKAIEYLEEADFDDHTVSSLATGALGDAYIELGDLPKGVKYYMKAAKKNDNILTSPMFYKKAGLVYENLGEHKDALEVYSIIKEKYSSSPEGRDIDKYISRARMASEQD